MLVYRAYIPSTGEILESDLYRNVYRCAMYHAKGEAMDSKQVVIVRIYKCDETAGFCSADEEPVCMIAVGVTGYTIDYNGVVISVDKDSYNMEV